MVFATKLDSVVFDLDGTLVRLPVDWRAVRAELAPLTGPLDPAQQLFDQLRVVLESKSGLKEPVFALLDKHESSAARLAELVPHAHELLSLASRNRVLGLVTMQGAQPCRIILERLHMRDFFREVVTREYSLSRGSQIAMILRKLDVQPEHSAVVGDRIEDVRSAREVGALGILVGKRAALPSQAENCFPRFVELKELSAAIAHITGS